MHKKWKPLEVSRTKIYKRKRSKKNRQDSIFYSYPTYNNNSLHISYCIVEIVAKIFFNYSKIAGKIYRKHHNQVETIQRYNDPK